jgi:hypothetical protein
MAEVTDPNNAQELLCNGPFNLSFQGQGNHKLAVLTFTQTRPDPTPMFQENKAVERTLIQARIAMSVPNLIALRDLLSNNVKTETDISPASAAGSSARH